MINTLFLYSVYCTSKIALVFYRMSRKYPTVQHKLKKNSALEPDRVQAWLSIGEVRISVRVGESVDWAE
jgi:hypothetical protein